MGVSMVGSVHVWCPTHSRLIKSIHKHTITMLYINSHDILCCLFCVQRDIPCVLSDLITHEHMHYLPQ